MSNFKDDILKMADGEPIENIVIGSVSPWEREETIPSHIRDRVISWEEALSLLDYEHGVFFDGLGPHPFTAWTASKVIFVSVYGGETLVESVPRNPTPHTPTMPGERPY